LIDVEVYRKRLGGARFLKLLVSRSNAQNSVRRTRHLQAPFRTWQGVSTVQGLADGEPARVSTSGPRGRLRVTSAASEEIVWQAGAAS